MSTKSIEVFVFFKYLLEQKSHFSDPSEKNEIIVLIKTFRANNEDVSALSLTLISGFLGQAVGYAPYPHAVNPGQQPHQGMPPGSQMQMQSMGYGGPPPQNNPGPPQH